MLEHFYQLGIQPDWWSCRRWPAPVGADLALYRARRSVVPASLSGWMRHRIDCVQVFAEAAGHPMIKGFAVGRTIFGQPSRRWMQGELDDSANR